MAKFGDDFQFPDEKEAKGKPVSTAVPEEEFEVEIEKATFP